MCSTNKALPAQTLGHWRAHLNGRAVCSVLVPTLRRRRDVVCEESRHSLQTTRSTRLLRHQVPVLRAAAGHQSEQSAAEHKTALDSDDYDELDDFHNAIEDPGQRPCVGCPVPFGAVPRKPPAQEQSKCSEQGPYVRIASQHKKVQR